LRWENGNEMMLFIMYANADACKFYVFLLLLFLFWFSGNHKHMIEVNIQGYDQEI
jgi:hypothetical protein